MVKNENGYETIMNTDSIMCVFQFTETHTKVALSLANTAIYRATRYHITSLETAIEMGDVFSVVNHKYWYTGIGSIGLGSIGSIPLILAYQKYDSVNYNWALYGACRRGHIDVVYHAIQHGADDWNLGLRAGCRRGHMSIVCLMLDLGATDINTGLDKACAGGHISVVELMINLGANPRCRGFIKACSKGHLDIVKLLLYKNYNRVNAGLSNACRGDHKSVIQFLLDKGATRCFNCRQPASKH